MNGVIGMKWVWVVLVSGSLSGFLAGKAVSPSDKDIDLATRQARIDAIRECDTPRGREFRKGTFQNSTGKEY